MKSTPKLHSWLRLVLVGAISVSAAGSLVASWKGGNLSRSAWESYCQLNRISIQQQDSALSRFVGAQLAAQEMTQAIVDGSLPDSGRTLRWKSVEQRILSEILWKTDPSSRGFGLSTQYAVVQSWPKSPEPSESTLKIWWEKNQTRWKTPRVYVLSALASEDSAVLANAIKGVTDLSSFQQLSRIFPVGSPAAPNGALGRVKHQSVLPFEIGLAPELFGILEKVRAGAVVRPVRIDIKTFLSVYVEDVVPPETKRFEDAREDARAEWMNAFPWTPDPRTVVARWDKGDMFTAEDVAFVAQEIPASQKSQFPSKRILDMMVNWKVASRRAVEVGIDRRDSVVQFVTASHGIVWDRELTGSLPEQKLLDPTGRGEGLLASWKSRRDLVWVPDSTEQGRARDKLRLLVLADGELERTWGVRKDAYVTGTTIPEFREVAGKVLDGLRPELDRRLIHRRDSILFAKYAVVIKAAPNAISGLAPAVAFDSGLTRLGRKSFDQAEVFFRQVARDPRSPDSLRSQAIFQLGQVFSERQEYQNSLEMFRTVLQRNPGPLEACKAQFMIAFTYSEYVKKEAIALSEYGKVLANHPKCELASDADFMIRNIQSGGALARKMEDSANAANPGSKEPVSRKSEAPAVELGKAKVSEPQPETDVTYPVHTTAPKSVAATPVAAVPVTPRKEVPRPPANGRRKVAVKEPSQGTRKVLKDGEAEMLGDALREGMQGLPRDRFQMMTRDNITELLPPGKSLEECLEGSCEVEMGRKLGANYLVVGKVLRVDGDLWVTFNLHRVSPPDLLLTRKARGRTISVLLDPIGVIGAEFRGKIEEADGDSP